MPIPIEREPGFPSWFETEHCCFCGAKTVHWHTPKDVAVCEPCAEIHEPVDVPSKAEWCASPQGRGIRVDVERPVR